MWAMTAPITVETLLLSIVAIVNTAIISSDGPSALAAVSTVEVLNWLIFGTFQALALGTTVLVSRAHGSGKKEAVARLSVGSIECIILLTIVYSGLVLLFQDQLVELLFGKAAPEVAEGIHIYLFGLLVTYPFRGVTLSVIGILRGIARTRATLLITVITNGLNVGLNVLFVLGLHMGIMGLVWSVAISMTIGLGVSVWMMIRFRRRLGIKKRDWLSSGPKSIWSILVTSFPFILEDLFFNGGKVIVQAIIVPFGTLALTANAVISAWIKIPEIIPRALGVATVPLVGTFLGQKDSGSVRMLTRRFVKIGSISGLVVNLILLPIYPWALKSFYHVPEELWQLMWILYGLETVGYMFFFTAQTVLPSALRAAGDGAYTTIAALASMWIYRIGVGYFVSVVLDFQLLGLWCVWVTEWGVRALLFYLRYHSGRWEGRQLHGLG